MSMKLVMEDGKELAIEDLQPIIIGEHKKVIITVTDDWSKGISLDTIIFTFDEFFGKGKWMLSAPKMQLNVIKSMEVEG